VTITHHPDDATLLAYAAGSLGEAASVVVAAHLAWCPRCRTTVRGAECVGGTLIDGLEAEPLSAGILGRCLQALDSAPASAAPQTRATAGDPFLPPVLVRRLGCPMTDIRWKRVAPGIQLHHLPLSPAARGRLSLVRIGTGRGVPRHGHSGSEITLVLTGSYTDRFGRFRPGDVADLDPEAEHDLRVDSEQACICLIAAESPMRFKGIIARLMQPFTGI
jgi:putative transcriptional regulator